ncbi:mechanosensitive ion channel family protein [Virgibacillus sp. AGTR]|uniref:mechanosensitive ion channel family protein n=1 Tax=Virgibacillus sp. AGTR TaxID=2812055 RepID=UPI0019627CAF|nr:mechanosensitive ion channel family protein [Virgibacillus sp. AGTR]MCC2252656.1 mechanosensitive ion channel family protein [Virgibacillus sp. AGTR]QRZ18989.1 mechanosensitive ion channel family protein [Virgibacillus sp. AGTR]
MDKEEVSKEIDNFSDELSKFWDYVTGADFWLAIGLGVLRILVILLLAYMIVRVTRKVVDRLFKRRENGPIRITERRENTLKKLIKSTITYVVYFIAFIMILDNVLGFQVGALLAGAGVAGLAIGFGAQNLVRDIISGFFIIFEDQFSVGDYVGVAGIEGTVEEIGLRTTKVLSWTGEMHILPNGNVTQVINYSIHNGLAIVDINVPYESSVDDAEKIINDVAVTLPDKYDFLVGVPEIIGVQNLEASYFVIRVIADTLPGFQWAGERNIRKEMQDKLYKAGIEIPAPRIVMYSREQKDNILNRDKSQLQQTQTNRNQLNYEESGNSQTEQTPERE